MMIDLMAGDAAFPDKLQALLTINAEDAARTNLEIWTKFNNVFQRVEGLGTYQPVFAKYYEGTSLVANVPPGCGGDYIHSYVSLAPLWHGTSLGAPAQLSQTMSMFAPAASPTDTPVCAACTASLVLPTPAIPTTETTATERSPARSTCW